MKVSHQVGDRADAVASDAPWRMGVPWTYSTSSARQTASYAGGLADATVALHNARVATGGVPWKATTGHRSDTVTFGPRRICGVRTTTDVQPALRSVDIADHDYFSTHGHPEVDPTVASDHYAEVVTYDPLALHGRGRSPALGGLARTTSKLPPAG